MNLQYGRVPNQESIPHPSSQQKQPMMLYTAENQNMVGAQPFEQDLGDTINRMPSLYLSRRHSERVLPSIEGGSQSMKDQSNFLEEYVEPASPSLQNRNATVRARDALTKVVQLDNDWSQPNMKRRRVEGFAPLSREEALGMEDAYEARRPTLIPLRDEKEYPMSTWQPVRSGYGIDKQPLEEEELHPRVEATSNFDRQRPSHVIHISDQAPTQRQYVVDADDRKYVPHEHFQIRLPRTGTGQQAESISEPLRAQADLRQPFPSSHALNKHVSPSYGVIDPYVSLHHVDNFSASGDRRVEGSTLVRTIPLRANEPEKITQTRSRDLEFRPRNNGQYTAEYNDGAMMGHVDHKDLHYSESNLYVPTKPRSYLYEQPQAGYHENARLGLQDLGPRREVYNQSTRPTAQFNPNHNSSEIYNTVLERSDERHIVRSLPRSQEARRYDLHAPTLYLDLRFGVILIRANTMNF